MTSELDAPPPPRRPIDRLTLLARAAHEARRYASADGEAISNCWRTTYSEYDRKARRTTLGEAEPLFTTSGTAGRRVSSRASERAESELESALKARAATDLDLQRERELRRDAEKKVDAQQVELFEARESLALQQRRIRELQEERSKLLDGMGQLESQQRRQANELDQVKLDFEKLKSKRQAMGDQAIGHVEKIQQLEAEVAQLRAELEGTRQLRDREIGAERERVVTAEGQTEGSAFRELWGRMSKEAPQVFPDTHTPTRQTFEHLCDSYVDFVQAFGVLERHVMQLLKDLRQVGEQSDKLSHFHIMFDKNPGLFDTLREYLTTGRRKGNYANLLRAHQTWARAFATGLYKVIVRAPNTIEEAMHFKHWPIKTSFTVGEEAAIGKYYKETALKQIPEQLGTRLRKQAGEMAYEDYDDLMKRR